MVENFDQFYDLYFDFSANLANRIIRDRDASWDIAQEVFLYLMDHQERLDFSSEERLKTLVSYKTRMASLDYMDRSCNRREMCIIDDEENGEMIIDERSNPETVILEMEDKEERRQALNMLQKENPVSYDILYQTKYRGVPPDEVAEQHGMTRNAVNNRNLRAKAWLEKKLKKIRRQP